MFSSLCDSIRGNAWMVHHEWRQRGSTNVQERLYPAVCRLAVSPLCFLELLSITDLRASSLCRVGLFGLEVLMLERQGRGVTRPLHWKNNKCERAWLWPASRLCATLLVNFRQQRKWCRLVRRLASYPPRVTRIWWSSPVNAEDCFWSHPAGSRLQLSVLVYDRPFVR